MLNIAVKILDPKIGREIPLPEYATTGSAGMDLRACIAKPLLLQPNACERVSTGIAVYIGDRHYAGVILARSGLGHNHGIILSNSVGLVDSDYQGELFCSLWNRSTKTYELSVGERIAQLVLMPILPAQLAIVKDFTVTTSRGQGGYGSTGTVW